MPATRRLAAVAIAATVFAGCSSSSGTSAPDASGAGKTAAASSLTVAYGENAQVELTAPSGERIVIDVWDPTSLTSQTADVLLVTHTHGDHYNAAFVDAFAGQKLVNAKGDLTVGDIKVKSIAASHDESPVNEASPNNHILIIDFAGFKIVHMGSTGQLELTPAQLSAIGPDVDIAIGALQNVGGNDPNNRKQIDIVNQIHPKLVIPTHSSLDYVQLAGQEWEAAFTSKTAVTIPHDELPSETTLFCMGLIASSYGAILQAPESTW